MDTHQNTSASAVVFAYHDIGVRCLETLLELGVDIKLLVTHQDDQAEEIWFGSVADRARKNGIPVIMPEDPNTPEVQRQISNLAPDFLFSFYYRNMLGADLLGIPVQGAFNLHGSLLPRYRGRVPVNWAIIQGEKECGVSLHRMDLKPDAGNLLAQQAVPILMNDTAFDVFQKLKCAAEALLLDIVPRMTAGQAPEQAQDLSLGSYFSGRRPEDGRIDWGKSAAEIHNLVRAVAPPYPGAFFDVGSRRIKLLGSYFRSQKAMAATPRIYWQNDRFWADCSDGHRFMITDLWLNERPLDSASFTKLFGTQLLLNHPRSGPA